MIGGAEGGASTCHFATSTTAIGTRETPTSIRPRPTAARLSRRSAALYAGAGYDFLFRTDHWQASTSVPAPILWLGGIELDGNDHARRYFHIVCLGNVEGISREMGLDKAVESAQAQGALIVLAHPFWTGNSRADTGHFAFDGVEIYNHVCQWLNGKGDGRVFWDEMLRTKPSTLAFAVDDAHINPTEPGWNGGWIMVNAPVLTTDAIMDAIRRGNYYSTCGPDFAEIEFDGAAVSVRTSPVRFIRLVGPGSKGQRRGSFGSERFTAATFTVPADWQYAYIEIEDECGRRAWTNTLFT